MKWNAAWKNNNHGKTGKVVNDFYKSKKGEECKRNIQYYIHLLWTKLLCMCKCIYIPVSVAGTQVKFYKDKASK